MAYPFDTSTTTGTSTTPTSIYSGDLSASSFGTSSTQVSTASQITDLANKSALEQLKTALESFELTKQADQQALWSMVANQASAQTTRFNKLQQAMNQI
ncbi:hypothetical protein RCH09_003458 [Actimicrobium sp. GrIS 1.19]|uniref:hypothetical protein n=1 Tax=Actimicrobium sp. GrIS 1.19 TaxID=3071708 RepID=UPI002DF8EDDD|nr:hypothetical protein [Actimicrobium sp. GrIS 1.19]